MYLINVNCSFFLGEFFSVYLGGIFCGQKIVIFKVDLLKCGLIFLTLEKLWLLKSFLKTVANQDKF